MTLSNTTTLDSLWTAVEADPNDVDRLQRWIVENDKRLGLLASRAALKRAADLPGSWLAKIWLTRPMLLDEGRLKESLDLYREALRLAPRKSLAVQEISGHLGEAGYFQEAVDFLLPLYSPTDHGPWAGLNLFNLCEDARDLDSAQEVLNRMKAVNWSNGSYPWQLNEIVRIRQEKLDILREMKSEYK
jgi:tetratricopeptide (TPR) repeat protein